MNKGFCTVEHTVSWNQVFCTVELLVEIKVLQIFLSAVEKIVEIKFLPCWKDSWNQIFCNAEQFAENKFFALLTC